MDALQGVPAQRHLNCNLGPSSVAGAAQSDRRRAVCCHRRRKKVTALSLRSIDIKVHGLLPAYFTDASA